VASPVTSSSSTSDVDKHRTHSSTSEVKKTWFGAAVSSPVTSSSSASDVEKHHRSHSSSSSAKMTSSAGAATSSPVKLTLKKSEDRSSSVVGEVVVKVEQSSPESKSRHESAVKKEVCT